MGINMLVSTKGRYALRTMADLALHGNGRPVKIKDIAKRQGISRKYLEQIVALLSRAGLVRSIRGNQVEQIIHKGTTKGNRRSKF